MKLSHAIKDIVEVIPEYPNLDQSEKDWLLQQYIFNYKRGIKSIQPDIFINEKNITYQDISERVNSYPEVKLSDTEFLKKLAREEVDSLDAILDESTSQEDFVYEVYEENFMDRVPHKINKGNIPKSLEQYDIAILLQEAFSQGVISNLDTLAKQFIVNYARKMLKKAKSNLAVAEIKQEDLEPPDGKWYQAYVDLEDICKQAGIPENKYEMCLNSETDGPVIRLERADQIFAGDDTKYVKDIFYYTGLIIDKTFNKNEMIKFLKEKYGYKKERERSFKGRF